MNNTRKRIGAGALAALLLLLTAGCGKQAYKPGYEWEAKNIYATVYEAPGFSVRVPDDDWSGYDTATAHFLQRTGEGQEALLVLSQGTKNDEALTTSGKELFASAVDEMTYFVQSARYDSGTFENEETTTFKGIDSILFDGQFEFSTPDDSATYQEYGVFLDAEAGPVLISAIDCSETTNQGDELQIVVKDVASSITDLGGSKTE